jgi:hypothetical protein
MLGRVERAVLSVGGIWEDNLARVVRAMSA